MTVHSGIDDSREATTLKVYLRAPLFYLMDYLASLYSIKEHPRALNIYVQLEGSNGKEQEIID